MSMLARDYIRKQQLKATEEIEQSIKVAELKDIEAKHEDLIAVKEAKKMTAKQRRESLINRGIISVQHKKKQEEMKQAMLIKEKEDFELKRLNDLDIQKYKKECKEQKRKSLEQRNKLAKLQHDQELKEEEVTKEAISKCFNDQYQDWLSKKEYEKTEKNRRRDSIAKRNEYYFTHIKC